MTVYIEIDGQPVDAREVVWCMFAPCGCMNGASTSNRYAEKDSDLVISADQSMADYCEYKIVTQRTIEDGFICKPLTWDQFKADESFGRGCEHTPKWGRREVPIPDGMAWVSGEAWYASRRTHIKHLALEGGATKALCGKEPRPYTLWSAKPSDLSDTVTCRKCESKADEMVLL